MNALDHQLRLTAAGQRGLVSVQQARTCGLTDMDLRRMVRRGWLQQVQPRVYRLVGTPDDPFAPVLAAVLSASEGHERGPAWRAERTSRARLPGLPAVASHFTAAALHGLQRVGRLAPIEICVPQGHRDELWDVVVHRTRRLEECDVVEAQGIACTSPARTLIDLAAKVDRHLLTALIDDSLGLGLVGRAWLTRRAEALRSGRPGVGLILNLTGEGAEGNFRSWLERRAAFVIEAGQIPRPIWNHPVHEAGRLLGIADACWQTARLIAEFDGLRFHSTPQQRRDDAARERKLVLAGWRVLRFTWQDVEQKPQSVVEALRTALATAI